jgi:hypothetical protein
MREGRWVIADLSGKGGRIRTMAISVWGKQGIQLLDERRRNRGRKVAEADFEDREAGGRAKRLSDLVG